MIIMTISQMQEILTKLSQKHGNIEVFFDCPKCNESYTPNKVATIAVHMKEEK